VSRSVRAWDEFNGRVSAIQEVQLRPRVSGYIDRVAYREGDEVRAGDLLFVIDPRPYHDVLDSAVAQLERARATAALAQTQNQRAQTLIAAKAISREEFDSRQAGLAQTAADVRTAEAAVATAKLNLGFTEVRAPISGRAGRALLTVGNLAQADQSMLTSLVSQDAMYVYFDCDEHSYLRYNEHAGEGTRRKDNMTVRVGLANEDEFPRQVIARITQIAHEVLPRGIVMEWTDLSYQQVTQSRAAAIVFPLSILLAFLVLAALFESWTLPLAVILMVPVCMCAALLGVWLTGGDNNIFVQVGLVVLMGLACKNAILIVEFARELEMQGKGVVEAALEACRLRLRPIVMTSIAFIAGSIPLLSSSGAGSEVRAATGMTVFAGMLGVTVFGLFLTPVFYVSLRKLARRKPAAWQDARGAHA
jgi:biotin carboxyl carrier protein